MKLKRHTILIVYILLFALAMTSYYFESRGGVLYLLINALRPGVIIVGLDLIPLLLWVYSKPHRMYGFIYLIASVLGIILTISLISAGTNLSNGLCEPYCVNQVETVWASSALYVSIGFWVIVSLVTYLWMRRMDKSLV